MTPQQHRTYRSSLWPAACKAQGWKTTDETKRREITLRTTGRHSTAGLNNKQVDALFDELKHLADPYNLDKAIPAANHDVSEAEGDKRRIIARVLRAAEQGGFNEGYLARTAKYKCKLHKVHDWRDLPADQLVNFSKTITARAAAKIKSAVTSTVDHQDEIPF